ncbi:hypothetical protein J6I75_04675 [Pseudidiomarina sp. 1APP75-27a]|nr:hypothetical protein [Pseudidiomarina sp. 1APP75-27a]MEA3587638.1 hypothetical protein [Pseudidiomarina sp. 1APP75-27a]
MNIPNLVPQRTPASPAEKTLYVGIALAGVIYGLSYFIQTNVFGDAAAALLETSPEFISYLCSGILFAALLQYIVRELPRDS